MYYYYYCYYYFMSIIILLLFNYYYCNYYFDLSKSVYGTRVIAKRLDNNDLDNRLSKASSFFGRLSKRVWPSHSFRLSTKIQVYKAVQTPGFSSGGRSGYWSGFTNAACTPSLATNGKTTCRTKKSTRQPACPA